MLPLLFARRGLSKSATNRKNARERRRRRLVLERLEDRRLLTITDMAAISGILFYQLPGGVEQPVPGETVSLYKDDGDGVFNSAIDTLKATDVTDAVGKYRFDSLTEGIYFVVQPPEPSGNIHPTPTPLVVTVPVTAEDANGDEGIVLDEFGTQQALTAQRPPAGTTPVSGNVVAPDAIGGYRQLIVNAFQGNLPVEAKINENNNSLFNYAEGPDARGSAIVFWDGTAGNHTTVNPTGLNGVDLTSGGFQDAFVVVIPVTDIPAELTIVVFSDAGRVSQTMIQVPFLSTDFSLVIPFSSFTPVPGFGAADFSEVGAVTFEIKKDPDPFYTRFGLDIQLDVIRTVGPKVLERDLPYNVASEIHLVKLTNGTDNDLPTGPLVPVGNPVTWTYLVTNPGNESIANVTVMDDQPGVNPAPVLSGAFNVGDINTNHLLEPGEEWQFTAAGIAVAGQYANLGTAVGTGTVSGSTLTDTNPDHYFGADSAIDIEKATNGEDADAPTGPLVAEGDTVAWSYLVTNPGNVPLSNVTVIDDNGTPADPLDDFSPTFVNGDTNNDGLLDPGETWLYEATGTALAGQYGNVATVTGTDPIGQTPSDDDPSHYFGVRSVIDIEKLTNGEDADTPTGPLVAAGSTVTWTYLVTNPGNVPLSNVVVVDDNGTPADSLDDFSPTFVGGDTNNDGLLDPGETWRYEATSSAQIGQYANVATVTGTDPIGQTPSDDDPSHYFGVDSAIHIEKATNGQDADTPTGPLVAAGSNVTWSYQVTNPGNVPLSNVVVRDDNGTPADPLDDFSPTFVGGDTNNDGLLDPGETWEYEATGSAQINQYANVATVTGTDPIGQTPSDDDPSH
ncbi:MAG: hypothetical protein KJ000_26625, partial [Pirellulaceae bacterium]|nr:hypothetical protein [Pirellulaceae bacterium]